MKGKVPRTKGVQEPPPGYNESAIVIYETADGVRLDVKLERDTLWLTQKQIAELFQTERSVITKHLNNIFASGELDKESNVQKMHIAGSDRSVAFHTLDAIISVGYRVNSKRGTQFRIWATSVLRDHLLKGYSVYFLIKDHPFVDGNKRIGAALFLWFLEKNEALYRPDGTKRIADAALVAMTLLIAESKPVEKEILTRVLINLIGRRAP